MTSPKGPVQLSMKDGLFTRGHDPSFTTSLTLGEDIARKIFVEATPRRECRRSSRARSSSKAISRRSLRCRRSSRASSKSS